jgi:hypothetical protein
MFVELAEANLTFQTISRDRSAPYRGLILASGYVQIDGVQIRGVRDLPSESRNSRRAGGCPVPLVLARCGALDVRSRPPPEVGGHSCQKCFVAFGLPLFLHRPVSAQR